MAHPITDVHLLQALDSRGNPTVRARVHVGSCVGTAIAPSGASSGSHEAPFLRDGQGDYLGRAVSGVISARQDRVQSALVGIDADDPAAVEASLTASDGSANWTHLGGNVAMAVSVAAWLAAAQAQNLEPWRLLASWFSTEPSLPLPMVNIISGGAHAAKAIDIQDVLVIPVAARSAEDAIHTAWQVRARTREVLTEAGHQTALIADEGGLAAPFAQSREAIAAVRQGIQRASDPAAIALDVAATEFEFTSGRYRIDGVELDSHTLVERIAGWISDFGVVSVEDPLAEDDNWSAVHGIADQAQVVGDDRYATNADRLAVGIKRREANAVLVKPNQAGSLFRAVQTLLLAKRNGWATVVSARSGETEESWLVDLAVGLGAGQLKVGSTMRSERTAKWNRLLELSAIEKVPFTHWESIRGSRSC